MRLAILILLIASAWLPARAPVAAGAQAPPRVVRGVIVDAATGLPLVRARVEARPRLREAIGVLSGAAGEFSVAVSTADPLFVRFSKAGYAAIDHTIEADDVGRGPLRVEMSRGAAVSGRIVTADGEPAPVSVMIRALDRRREDVATVDDRGEFRFGGLPAGRYAIRPLFEGLAARADAIDMAVVELQSGTEVSVGTLMRPPAANPAPIEPAPATAIGRGAIAGRLLSSAGEPVSGATVSAQATGGRRASTTTDARGRFTLRGLPPGSFVVMAAKWGFLTVQYGERGAGLPPLPIEVAEGRTVDGIDLVLPPASAISGTVVDEFGEPMQDATVFVLRVSSGPGMERAIRDQAIGAQRSDDRGSFRLWGLAPGNYIVTAMASLRPEPVQGQRQAYAPVYYPPGAADPAAAWPLQVAAGEDVPGVVLTLRPIPVFSVSGRVVDAAGAPVATSVVRLAPDRSGRVAMEARQVHPEADGGFVFADVPPGRYSLQATHMDFAGRASRLQFGSAAVAVVNQDPQPVTLRTGPGATVSGRLVLEGEPGAMLWGYSARTQPVEAFASNAVSSSVSGPVADGTTFLLSGLAGPMRLLFSSPDANWYLESILVGGVDVTDQPFDFGYGGREYTDVEVVFARGGASVAGTVADERGTPVREYAVIAFSSRRDEWFAGSRRLRLARAGADGTFAVEPLPPGDYWIAAVDRVDGGAGAGDWQDPEVLQTLTRDARRVTLGPGEVHRTALRLIRR